MIWEYFEFDPSYAPALQYEALNILRHIISLLRKQQSSLNYITTFNEKICVRYSFILSENIVIILDKVSGLDHINKERKKNSYVYSSCSLVSFKSRTALDQTGYTAVELIVSTFKIFRVSGVAFVDGLSTHLCTAL